MYLVMNNRRAKNPLQHFQRRGRDVARRTLATAIIPQRPDTGCDCVLVLMAVRPAQAQPETVLYSFYSQPNCSDGAYPQS